jgi:hypothetical protein
MSLADHRAGHTSDVLPFIPWNSALEKNIEKFVASHPDVTAMVYSSYDTFSRVFNNPSQFGFQPSTAHRMGGPIWLDHLHPTSAMHAVIAGDIADFLISQKPIVVSSAAPATAPQSHSSVVIQTGLHWSGLAQIKHLIILYVRPPLSLLISDYTHIFTSGASYCQVGYDKTCPHPTVENPLGVAFPGTTYSEPDTPNWVGHLVTRLKSQDQSVLVYDFGLGGDTVHGVERQIKKEFMPELAAHPLWAPWKDADTLVSEWSSQRMSAISF